MKDDFGMGATPSPSPEVKHDFGMGATPSPLPKVKHNFSMGATPSPLPEVKHDLAWEPHPPLLHRAVETDCSSNMDWLLDIYCTK